MKVTALILGITVLGVSLSILAPFASAANFPLLVVSQNTNQVLEYSGSDGSYLGPFASTASTPASIIQGPNGNFFVSNFGTGGFPGGPGTIQEFNKGGGLVGSGTFVNSALSATPGAIIGEVFAPDGNLYFSTPNDVLRANGTTGVIDPSFDIHSSAANVLRTLAVVPTGGNNFELAIANGGGNGTVLFVNSVTHLQSTSTFGGAQVQGLQLLANGTLLATDSFNGLYRLPNAGAANYSTPTGPSFSLFIAPSTHLNVPLRTTTDAAGNIYVTNGGGVNSNPSNNVVEYSAGGTYITDFVGSGSHGLSGAQGLVFLTTPEPSSLVLAGFGAVGLCLLARKRSRLDAGRRRTG